MGRNHSAAAGSGPWGLPSGVSSSSGPPKPEPGCELWGFPWLLGFPSHHPALQAAEAFVESGRMQESGKAAFNSSVSLLTHCIQNQKESGVGTPLSMAPVNWYNAHRP